MSNITIKAGLNSEGFRAGLKAMQSEAKNFSESFKKNIESGGGFLSSIDRAFGKLATGRLAWAGAALGASLQVVRAQIDGINNQWENFSRATERAAQGLEGVKSIQAEIAQQKYAGDRANAEAQRQANSAFAEMKDKTRESTEFKDPSTIANAFSNAVTANGRKGAGARTLDVLSVLSGASLLAEIAGKVGIGKGTENPLYLGAATALGARGVPFATQYYEAQNKLYNDRLDAAKNARLAAEGASGNLPYVEYANRSEQRSAQGAQISAEDKLGVAQGRTTGYEAAANKFLMANSQYQDALKTYGGNENDPRVIQAKAAALDAFTSYDSELTNARKFRNDPTIVADSLSRLGGGGNVTVFGNGQGELLFEQKRMTQSIQQLIPLFSALNVNLSRINSGGDVSQ